MSLKHKLLTLDLLVTLGAFSIFGCGSSKETSVTPPAQAPPIVQDLTPLKGTVNQPYSGSITFSDINEDEVRVFSVQKPEGMSFYVEYNDTTNKDKGTLKLSWTPTASETYKVAFMFADFDKNGNQNGSVMASYDVVIKDEQGQEPTTFVGPLELNQSELYTAGDNGKLAQVYELMNRTNQYNDVVEPQWMNKSYTDPEVWHVKLTKDEGDKLGDGIDGNGTWELTSIVQNENGKYKIENGQLKIIEEGEQIDPSQRYNKVPTKEDLDAGIPDQIYEILKNL